MRKQAAESTAEFSASCPGCDWDIDDVEDDPEWHADHHAATGLVINFGVSRTKRGHRIIFDTMDDKRWFMFMRGILTADEYAAS